MSANNSIVDLQEIVEQWAKQWLILAGSKSKVESVDINAKSEMMKGHPSIKVSFDYSAPIEYGPPDPTPEVPTAAYSQTSRNDSTASQETNFVKIHETTSALTFSVTAGFSASLAYSIDVSASAGVEGIAEAGVSANTTATFTVNLSSTVEQSNTVTETWEINQNITNPPMAVTTATWLLKNRKSVYTWKLPTQMRGKVAVRFSDKVDPSSPTFRTKPVAPQGQGKHQLWFFDVADVFSQIAASEASYSGLPDFTVDGASQTVSLIARGSLVAEGAFKSDVETHQTPLPAPAE
jgi:hypothetical protein